jgi:hypothetical protein
MDVAGAPLRTSTNTVHKSFFGAKFMFNIIVASIMGDPEQFP